MHRYSLAMACAMATLHGGSLAHADEHHDLYDQTNWYHFTNSTIADVDALIDTGYRLVDLEIENTSPFRVGGAMVANSGSYGTAWWWWPIKTESELNDKLSEFDARLIDIEPYLTSSNEVRYAAIAVPDSGPTGVTSTDWETGFTELEVNSWLATNPTRRIHDIQPYPTPGGETRYAFTWVGNTGSDFTLSWLVTNDSLVGIEQLVADTSARIVDIEPVPNGGWAAVLIPTKGDVNWWWYYDLDPNQGAEVASKLGGRVADAELYNVNGEDRMAFVIIRNCTDLSLEANRQLRDSFSISTDSGLLLRKLGGESYAGVNKFRQFEPASAIKTFHHFHTILECAVGSDDLNDALFYAYSTESCPDPNDPIVLRTINQTLFDMMINSNNSSTEAIRNRYGTDALQSTADIQIEADGTEFNHILGCFCLDSTPNQTTLEDLASLHTRVSDGWLVGFRDTFYDLMVNDYAAFSLVLNQELGASSLSEGDQDLFRSFSVAAGKSGGYTCSSKAHLNRGAYRSRAAYLALPRKEGCDLFVEEFFVGCWINDLDAVGTGGIASGNVQDTMAVLYRDRIRAAIAAWDSSATGSCIGDLTGDCEVGGADLSILLAAWGTNDPEADLNGDNLVNGADLTLLLSGWGLCSG